MRVMHRNCPQLVPRYSKEIVIKNQNTCKIMEISVSTTATFYLCRICGLAPYLTTKSERDGGISGCRKSKILNMYSFSLIIGIVLLTYCRGIIYDTQSNQPISYAYRMKTDTSKVVTILDISVVAGACIFGMVCGICGGRHTQKLNDRLKKVDEILGDHIDKEASTKRRCNLLLCLVMLLIVGALALDMCAWDIISRTIFEKNSNKHAELNLVSYLPFYGLYFILLVLHVEFAQTALGIAYRYRTLNEALARFLIEHEPECHHENGVKEVREINSKLYGEFSIGRLPLVYSLLGKAVDDVSSAFGLALLVVLTSVLLHLVSSSYFLLIEIIGDKDAVFTWLQLLWLFVHTFRFLLIVEPCHKTFIESRKTIRIVCDLMKQEQEHLTVEQQGQNDRNHNKKIKKQLKMFWRQLMGEGASSAYTACGLCLINRQIITSYCGVIATYLVILIQFYKSTETAAANATTRFSVTSTPTPTPTAIPTTATSQTN